jgi:hypothetical protein
MIGIMCLEHKIHYADGEVYEMILVQNNITEVNSMLILGSDSIRVIYFSKFQIKASTIILRNKSGTSTVQISFVAIIKLKPSDDNMFVLSNLKMTFVHLLILQIHHHVHLEVLISLIHNFLCIDPNPRAVLCAGGWFAKSHLLNVLHYILHLHL